MKPSPLSSVANITILYRCSRFGVLILESIIKIKLYHKNLSENWNVRIVSLHYYRHFSSAKLWSGIVLTKPIKVHSHRVYILINKCLAKTYVEYTKSNRDQIIFLTEEMSWNFLWFNNYMWLRSCECWVCPLSKILVARKWIIVANFFVIFVSFLGFKSFAETKGCFI